MSVSKPPMLSWIEDFLVDTEDDTWTDYYDQGEVVNAVQWLYAHLAERTAERDAARTLADEATEDITRIVTQRNLALERAAAEILPGPDGQDDIDRRRLIQTWHEEAWPEVDGWREQWQQVAQRALAVEAALAECTAERDAADAVIRRLRDGWRPSIGWVAWIKGGIENVMSPTEAEALRRARAAQPQEPT